MSLIVISVLSIYFFILIGFSVKKAVGDAINERSMTLVSIYCLQPFLAFWGLTKEPIDANLIMAPAIYALVSLLILAMMFPVAYSLFKDTKDRSIALAAPVIGNTGNLGIPLGIVVLGEASATYTNAINLVNVFMVYTIGVFLYSRGEFSIRESLFNILKMPVLWVAMIAIIVNLNGVTFIEPIERMLQMGAYASIVIQLLLFGFYMASIRPSQINQKLTLFVTLTKFALLPLAGLIILSLVDLPPIIRGSIFLELIVPVAVMNAALSTLYNCKPEQVTLQVLITSILFIGISVGAFTLFDDLLGVKYN